MKNNYIDCMVKRLDHDIKDFMDAVVKGTLWKSWKKVLYGCHGKWDFTYIMVKGTLKMIQQETCGCLVKRNITQVLCSYLVKDQGGIHI